MIEEQIIVTVVVPIYNTELYLNDCLISLINQSYNNLQIILVNDGSTDNSLDICNNYAAIDKRIDIISKENGGQSSARNAAIEKANGKYIYFLDSDDYIKMDAISELVETAEKENADFVFFEAESFVDNPEKNPYGLNELTRNLQYKTTNSIKQYELLESNKEFYVCTPLHFYKLDYLNQNKIRFLEGVIHEDELLSVQVYLCNGLAAHCHKTLYERRIRPESTMTSRNDSVNLFRYNSGYSIYFAFHKFIISHNIKAKVKRISAFRIIPISLLYFQKLNDNQKSENYLKHKKLKRHILFHYGLSDYRLAQMCSGRIINKMINILLKLRILKKKS